jgi:hypothetical protein
MLRTFGDWKASRTVSKINVPSRFESRSGPYLLVAFGKRKAERQLLDVSKCSNQIASDFVLLRINTPSYLHVIDCELFCQKTISADGVCDDRSVRSLPKATTDEQITFLNWLLLC